MASENVTSYFPRAAVRLISVLAVVVIAVLLPHAVTTLVFYALALGHVAIAFLYQKDAGKWNIKKLSFAFVVLVALAVFCNLYPTTGFVVTSFAFILHMMLDETHLFGSKPSLVRTLESLPFIALWGGLTLHVAYGMSSFVIAYVLAGLFLLARIALSVFGKRIDALSFVHNGWALLALVACLVIQAFGILVPAVIWFFGLATVHFLLWYGDYFMRVAGDAVRRNTYLRRTLLVNVVSAVLAVLFGFGTLPFLILFFGAGFVNAWSLIHIGSSLRISTLRLAVSGTG